MSTMQPGYVYGGAVLHGYKFTGKERDTESNLDYFGARYNASSLEGALGRMMSPDSGIDQHSEDPQSWNLYSYGRNNPLVMVDPTGEYVCGSGVTQSMCDYFQNELDAAQKGPNALKDKYGADSTQYTDVQRATEGVGLRLPKCREEGGFTLLELIVAAAILSILTMMALPLARVTIQREREKELHKALWEMRDAIDRYKDQAERGAFQMKVDTYGYPPDLETLVKGIESQGGKKIRFLRSIPVDPMTKKEWGLRSMQDDPDSDSWGGQNVFDVYTKSQGEGLDGTKYKDW